MSKQRCMNCQYYNDDETCFRHKIKRDRFDECLEVEHQSTYYKSNNRDSIENVVNDIANLVEMEKCFFDPKQNYRLEVLSKKLLKLVEQHGVHSWKYD